MCSKIAAYEYSDCTPLNKDLAPLPDSSMPSPRLLVVGRTPNGKKISAEKAGVAVTDRGFIKVDMDFTRIRRHISISSSKSLECQRAQLV